MRRLNSYEFKYLKKLLLDRFPSIVALQELALELDVNHMDQLATGDNVSDIFHKLISKARDENWLFKLMDAAKNLGVDADGLTKLKGDLQNNQILDEEGPQDSPQNDVAIYSTSPMFHPDIIGRESEMKQILHFVSDKDNKNEAFVNINGAPGMGKTALAANICRALQNEYQIVWIYSKAFKSLLEIREALAEFMRVQSMTVQELRSILHNNQIILVFDQIDHLVHTALRDLLITLDAGTLGKVVLTSCASSGLNNEKTILLKPLTLESSQQLLVRAWGKSWEELDDSQKNDVEIICQEYLQGVPMQINQIGSKAREVNDSHLTDWINSLAEMDANTSLYKIEHESAYKSEIEGNRRTIATLFEHLDKFSKELLSRLALVDSKVSFRDSRKMAKARPAINDNDFKSAENQLRKGHLIERDDHKMIYVIHSNVREYVFERHLKNAPNLKDLERVAAEILVSSKWSVNWSQGLKYLFDVEEWFDLIQVAKTKSGIYENTNIFPNDSRLLLKIRAYYVMAHMFYRQGDFEDALGYAEVGVDLLKGKRTLAAKSLLIRFNTTIAYCLKKMDYDLENVKRFIDANELILQKISEKDRDLLIPDLGQHLLMKCIYETQRKEDELDRKKAKLDNAEKYALEAQEIFKKVGDENYQLMTLSNLATVCYKQGRIDDSISYSKKILNSDLRTNDYYIRAVEYVNLVDTFVDAFIEIENYEQALLYLKDEQVPFYLEKGIKYCRDYDQSGPLITLLLNAVYVAVKPEIAREWITDAKKYLAAIRIPTNLDKAQINAAWAIVNYLEAIDAEIHSRKIEKLKTARKFAEDVYQVEKEAQDEQIESEADRLRQKKKIFETTLGNLNSLS